MADDADRAQEQREREESLAPKRQPYVLAKGEPGDCDLCGDWSGRLISGMCAPCRDFYKVK